MCRWISSDISGSYTPIVLIFSADVEETLSNEILSEKFQNIFFYKNMNHQKTAFQKASHKSVAIACTYEMTRFSALLVLISELWIINSRL